MKPEQTEVLAAHQHLRAMSSPDIKRRIKTMTLTADRARELLTYDPETGDFYWRQTMGHRGKAGKIAGAVRGGYRIIGVEKLTYAAHRLAWLITFGSWPMAEIDHINGDPGDNRIANLRDVSRAENLQNQRVAQRRNKCGLLGVSFHKAREKWRAQIAINGKSQHLGYFDTPEEAHQAYVLKKRELHQACTL